jgi:ankyrin
MRFGVVYESNNRFAGHTDMCGLLIENGSQVNAKANNALSPLHLCAQEDKVDAARVLLNNRAEVNAQTKAGYTPLHVACHFGQLNMVRLLIGELFVDLPSYMFSKTN